MPRLLLVVNQSDTFFSHRIAWALGARDAGYQVHVAGPLGDAAASLAKEGLAVEPLRFPRTASRPWEDGPAVRKLVALLRSVRPDVAHFVTVKLAAYGGPAARLARVPAAVYSITGLGTGFRTPGLKGELYRAVLGRGLRWADGHPRSSFVFQNNEDAAELRRRGYLHHAQVHFVRGSGVDLSAFQPTTDPGESQVVVLAARMLWDKGVGVFAEAARMLKGSFPDARFVLAGGTDQNPASVPETQIRRWEREGILEWWGLRTDMREVLNRAGIVCLPSSYGEGLPKVLLEAGACGRPVITTEATGCRDAVDPGHSALLIPPNDAQALAAAIRTLLVAPEQRRAMGKYGREWVRQFGIEQVVQRLLEVYASTRGVQASDRVA